MLLFTADSLAEDLENYDQRDWGAEEAFEKALELCPRDGSSLVESFTFLYNEAMLVKLFLSNGGPKLKPVSEQRAECLSFALVILVGSLLHESAFLSSKQSQAGYVDHQHTAVPMVCVIGLLISSFDL